MTAKTEVASAEWKVKPLGDEDYRLEVQYRYEVEGKSYDKTELFQAEKFRNPYKAEGAIQDLKAEYHTVSYDPNYPDNASLENYFPTKKAVYLLILFFLFNYFLIVVRNYSKDKLKALKKPEGKSGNGRT